VNDNSAAIASTSRWPSARVARWAGRFGVSLPGITLVVYPIWLVPGTQTSGADLAQWATTNHDRLVVMMLLNTAGVALWFVFGAAVCAYLRDRLPAGSTLPTCFAGGFIGLAILILSGFTAFDLLLYRQHSAETTTLLYDLSFGLLAMSGIPTAISLASFAIAVYGRRVLPQYTAHLAIVAAAIHPVLLGAFIVHDGPLSLQGLSTTTGIPLLLFAWILGTALAMPRHRQ
jgi:hypothetical protein